MPGDSTVALTTPGVEMVPAFAAPSYRLPVSLSEEQILFLEAVGLQAKRSGGTRLSKAAVVRALIDAVRRLDLDVDGVTNQEQLAVRVLETLAGSDAPPSRKARPNEEKTL